MQKKWGTKEYKGKALAILIKNKSCIGTGLSCDISKVVTTQFLQCPLHRLCKNTAGDRAGDSRYEQAVKMYVKMFGEDSLFDLLI